MAAGDLIVADYQAELAGLLMGAGTGFDFDVAGIVGLGIPAPKTNDLPLDHAPGSIGARDDPDVRTITIPLKWGGAGAAAAMNGLLTLTAAWNPVVADVPLYLRLPGWGKFHVAGRPRGLAEDLSRMPQGEAAALATFVALDPSIHFD
jgi:hypothetical protein